MMRLGITLVLAFLPPSWLAGRVQPLALPWAMQAPAVGQREAFDDRRVLLEGFVFAPGGAPAEGAVVVTSAGGMAVVDVTGHYSIEAPVPVDTERIQVTAVGRDGQNLVASADVGVSATLDWVPVDPLTLVQGSTCSPSWVSTFGGVLGVDLYVRALAVYDDGGGPALYVGGIFSTAGGVAANRVVKWDGSSWEALGSGMGGLSVDALAVYDDGGGLALYAGGSFLTAGGVAASSIAKWDGSNWAALGSGMNGLVDALVVYDDGDGPALYAGGSFTTAGGVGASNVAKWDGSSWTALGSGTNGFVHALAVYDDGSGPALHVGGDFTIVSGMTIHRIVKWDGSSWAALSGGANAAVRSLAVYDDGRGPALYLGGSFSNVGGLTVSCIARWDGSTWEALGSGLSNFPQVRAFAVYEDGGGPALFAGGDFDTAGGAAANHIAKWDGSSWTAVGSGMNDRVSALALYDDGGGSALYAGGHFTHAGDVDGRYIAKWDGASWVTLGAGMSSDVLALEEYDDGGGPALYAGGYFETAGGVAASRVAKWDGSSWTPLGSGMAGPVLNRVDDLAVFDDGGGPALYAGGTFTTAGGVAANYVAKWDGSSWSALAGGMDDWVLALAVYDDGGGPALYAGGTFTTAGGVAANSVAKWNGSSWAPLGSGVEQGSAVHTLAVYDHGAGPMLYAGGSFRTAGGVSARRIARWNGSSWAALGSGMNSEVEVIVGHDAGGGPALYAGGDFTNAGGVSALYIAKWNGSTWAPLGSGLRSFVSTFMVHEDGTGPALYVGGSFLNAGSSGDSFIAKWGCPDTIPPVLSCPPSIRVLDRPANGEGEEVLYSAIATDEQDPSPAVLFSPPSGSLFLPGTTLVTCTATDASGNQSTCQFHVFVDRKIPKASPR